MVCEIHSESEMCEMVDVTSKLLGGLPNPFPILKRFTVKFTVKKQKNVVKSHITNLHTLVHTPTDTRSKSLCILVISVDV